MKLYMFRTIPLSIIRSFVLYTKQWLMSFRFVEKLSSMIRMELHFHPDHAQWMEQDWSGWNCCSIL